MAMHVRKKDLASGRSNTALIACTLRAVMISESCEGNDYSLKGWCRTMLRSFSLESTRLRGSLEMEVNS